MRQTRFFVSTLVLAIVLVVGQPSQAQVDTRLIQRIGNGTARAAASSPDGKTIAIGGSLGIWLYPADLSKPLANFDSNDQEISAIAWNPNGKQLATAGGDPSEVQLWDAVTGTPRTLIRSKTQIGNQDDKWPGSISYSPDGSQLASANDNNVNIWDTTSGKLIATLNIEGAVHAVAWNPHDNRLAIGGSHLMDVPDYQGTISSQEVGYLQIWDAKTRTMVRDFTQAELNDQLGDDVRTFETIKWYLNGDAIAATTGGGYNRLGIFTWDFKNDGPDVKPDLGLSCGAQGTSLSMASAGPNYANGVLNCASGPGDATVASVHISGSGPAEWVFIAGSEPVQTIVWRPDSKSYLLIVNGDGEISIVDPTKGDESNYYQVQLLVHTDDFKNLPTDVFWPKNSNPRTTEYNYDYDHLATIVTKDLTTQKVFQTLNFPQRSPGVNDDPVQVWALSPDRKIIAVAVADHDRAKLLDVNTLQVIRELQLPAAVHQSSQDVMLHVLIWSPNGKFVAGDGVIWDAESGNATFFKVTYDTFVWSPDSKLILEIPLYHADKELATVHDAQSGSAVFSLDALIGQKIVASVWGPNGRSIAAISEDHQIRIWNVTAGKLLKTLPGHLIEWSADGKTIAVATEDNTVQLYNADTGAITATLKTGTVSATAFSHDNTRLATANANGAIQVWDVATGKLSFTLQGHKGSIVWLRWKSDDSQILSNGLDNTLRLWNAH